MIFSGEVDPHRQQRLERLRKLGVRKGAQDLARPAQAPAPAAVPDPFLPGEEVHTPFGPAWVREARYPLAEHLTLAEWLNVAPATLAALDRNDLLLDLVPSGAVFIDTETTGLSLGAGTYTFLIGVGTYEPPAVEDEAAIDGKGGAFVVRQYFMRHPGEERAQLHLVEEAIGGASGIVSFNGRGFDMPLVYNRFILASMPPPLVGAPHLDLLHPARRLWKMRWGSCSLGSLERNVLGLRRTTEDVPGYLIPEIYRQYYLTGTTTEMLARVFYHNLQDVVSMALLGARMARHFDRDALDAAHDGLEALECVSLARCYDTLGWVEASVRCYRLALHARDRCGKPGACAARVEPALQTTRMARAGGRALGRVGQHGHRRGPDALCGTGQAPRVAQGQPAGRARLGCVGLAYRGKLAARIRARRHRGAVEPSPGACRAQAGRAYRGGRGRMSQSNLTLVVLAAGIGSRYGGLKQMDPMGPSGEIIIDYSVYDALRAGFTKVVFVISKAIEDAFRERIGRSIEKQVETAYVFQSVDDVPRGFVVPEGRKKPWGTAHATLSSRDVVVNPLLVINADDFYGRSAYQSVADYLRAAAVESGIPDYCMVGYRIGNTLTEHGTVARAECQVDANGYLITAIERTKIGRSGEGANAGAQYTEDGEHWIPMRADALVSMNMWGFTPAIYEDLAVEFPRFLEANRANLDKAEFYIPNFVTDLIRTGRARIKVLPTHEKWHGVTYADDKPQVKAALQSLVDAGVYPANLWSRA